MDLKERRLKRLGHVLRMEDDRIPKQTTRWQMDWTHAPEEPEGRDRTGLTPYLEI